MSNPTWHYAVGGVQKGPVSDEDLARLAGVGIVTADTLVWREGMAGWEPYSRVKPAEPETAAREVPPVVLAATGPASVAVPAGQVRCGQCGQIVGSDDAISLAGRTICAACKPLAVQMLKEGVASLSSASEQIRRDHIKHEASIRSWGMLQILGGSLLLLGAVVGVAGLVASAPSAQQGQAVLGVGVVLSLVYGVFGAVGLWSGLGLRRLRPSARIVAAIISGIGLIAFPIGTLINGYILYLLLSKKGKMVFSDEYKRIIAETPHVRHRTSVIAWIVLALFIAALYGSILYFSMAR